MPRVQEYLPEQEAQGPVGQTSPMLEQVSDYGRGIQDFGKDVGDAGTIITQRQTQMETSNAYADVAEQRANYMQRIQDERNAGTLDDDGLNKIKQDYQDWTEKQYENYNTAGGKDAFVRASARAQGSIIQTAGRAQAVVSGFKPLARPPIKYTKRGPRTFGPNEPRVWEVAYRLGAVLRAAAPGISGPDRHGTHASPRPHIRRAPWHAFWTGAMAKPAQMQPTKRELILHWLPPIPVKVTPDTPVIPTMHPVVGDTVRNN